MIKCQFNFTENERKYLYKIFFWQTPISCWFSLLAFREYLETLNTFVCDKISRIWDKITTSFLCISSVPCRPSDEHPKDAMKTESIAPLSKLRNFYMSRQIIISVTRIRCSPRETGTQSREIFLRNHIFKCSPHGLSYFGSMIQTQKSFSNR